MYYLIKKFSWRSHNNGNIPSELYLHSDRYRINVSVTRKNAELEMQRNILVNVHRLCSRDRAMTHLNKTMRGGRNSMWKHGDRGDCMSVSGVFTIPTRSHKFFFLKSAFVRLSRTCIMHAPIWGHAKRKKKREKKYINREWNAESRGKNTTGQSRSATLGTAACRRIDDQHTLNLIIP